MTLALDEPDVVAEVTAAFHRYEAALVAHDEATLNALFWDDARVVRYGVADAQHGWAEIAAFRATQAPMAGGRVLSRLVVTAFGRDLAVANTEFRRADAPGEPGRQTQVWARLAEGWRVVGAHVSVVAAVLDGR